MGLAASALGRLGSGSPPRVTIIATSRARATTKEAAEKYGWKRLAAVNSDNALNASRAIQEIIETVLMFADIFISLRPGCAAPSEGERYTDWSLEKGLVRRACFWTASMGSRRGPLRSTCASATVRRARCSAQVRSGFAGGGKWIRTVGPPPEIVVDPSGSRRDHRAKYGCLSARPRVRCLCPPGKTQHLLPKSVFDRPRV